jgi:drug/metabolite transporter (DMT)-like permease
MRRHMMEPTASPSYGFGRRLTAIAEGSFVRAPGPPSPGSAWDTPNATGIACGVAAALFWAAGFVAGRHGIQAGLSPVDIAFHRYIWAGLLFLPFVARAGLADLGGVGWGRSAALTFFVGPPFAIMSYSGFLLVPLAHGGVVQPSAAALGGLLLAMIMLGEKVPARRAFGAAVIVGGLVVIGGEALGGLGSHAWLGDVTFALAGLMFATFSTLLRLWRITPMHAVAVTSVVSLLYIPVQWLVFGFDRMIAVGLYENLLQVVVQGAFSGAVSSYLFARSVVLLGVGRAAVFPSLVPGFTLLIGFLAIGEVPSIAQLVGFAIVLVGFRLTQT